MHLFGLLVALLNSLLLASASPTTNGAVTYLTASKAIETGYGIPGNVYGCFGYDFSDECLYFEQVLECYAFYLLNPGETENRQLRSIKPGKGGHCNVYKDRFEEGYACDPETLVKRIEWPGVKTAAELNPTSWFFIQCFIDPEDETPASEEKAMAERSAADIAGGVYVCLGADFTGDCYYNKPEKVDHCALLSIQNPSTGAVYKPVSIGPNSRGYCEVFRGRVCNDQTLVKRIYHPGVKNAGELNPDSWEAIRCYGTGGKASTHEEQAVELLVRSEDTPVTDDPPPSEPTELVVFPEAAPADVDSTNATAAFTNGDRPSPPQPGSVYYCEEENYQGKCFWKGLVEVNRCTRLVFGYTDGVHPGITYVLPKSLDPDAGGVCDIYWEKEGGKGCDSRNFHGSIQSGYTGSQLGSYAFIACCPGDGKYRCHV